MPFLLQEPSRISGAIPPPFEVGGVTIRCDGCGSDRVIVRDERAQMDEGDEAGGGVVLVCAVCHTRIELLDN